MYQREIKPLKSKSFFLFGPRGSGKSTLLQSWKSPEDLYVNLLDPEVAEDFRLSPNRFKALVLESHGRSQDFVVYVDEIQKVPKLLDVVHDLIQSKGIRFVLTGSSARRLKQSGVNLLAGRALVYNLFPFSSSELGSDFNLATALERGLLPDSYQSASEEEANEYLKAYTYTYLEKEIQQEQWVRKLEPFQRFLQIAAQQNGCILNRSAVSRDVGVDDMTIQNYFEILEDTLMGFYLPSFHLSVRKQQREAPKFYLVDTGIQRALSKTLDVPLKESTSAYGKAFEHFVILEIKKTIEYLRKQWSLSYVMTRDGVEIDLIIDRAGLPNIQVEIKSSKKISASNAKALLSLGKDLDSKAKRFILSQDPITQDFEDVKAYPWRAGIEKIFELS